MDNHYRADGMEELVMSRGGWAGGGHRRGAAGGDLAADVSRGGGAAQGLALPDVSRSQLAAGIANPGAGADLAVGDVIDKYVITEVSGKPGAFGRVWIAHSVEDIGDKVAIKEMLKEDEERQSELRATFKLVRNIKNDHIADPIRIAEKDGRLFTIMRFAPGKPLDEWFAGWREKHPSATARERLSIATAVCRQIADALDVAHRKRVMHLDIKPGNVMVEDLPDGGVKVQVLDFGLAERINPDGETLCGKGTAEYIAPEMWLGRPRPDGRADQYSLACVFYWLLSGTTPFRRSFEAAWRQLLRDMPDATENERKHVWRHREEEVGRKVVASSDAHPLACLDKGRNKALLRALEKDPGKRYRNCAAMVSAIQRGPSNAWKPFAAIAALIAVCGLSLFAWGHMETQRQEAIRKALERIKSLGGISGIASLRKQAEENDSGAAFELAQRLATGTNVQRDEAEAFLWFAKSGELGNADAMFEAGDRLERGIGVAKDEAAAAGWFRRAAEAGNPRGAGALAACMWDGRGVEKDRKAARAWAEKGLDSVVPSAQWVAGMALVEGIGPEHNPHRGASLVRSAANAGDARAQYALSGLFSRGAGVSADENEAAKWALMAAKQGLLEAMLDMGERYALGRGVPANPAESRRWFDAAAKTDPVATDARRRRLAKAESDRREAEAKAAAERAAAEAEAKADAADPARPLRRRAEAGDAFAAFELAKRLDDGIGLKKNPVEAVRWWKTLAEMSLSDSRDSKRRQEAWGRYGMHLLEGAGVTRDVAAAVPWLEKFADATEDEYGVAGIVGFSDTENPKPEQTPTWVGSERRARRGKACLAVARAYEKGDGVAKNIKKAESWYDKGYLDSDECLARLLRLMVERPRDFTAWELGERSALGALQGNLDGLYLDGRLKLEGRGGMFRKQGFQNVLKAAEAGHVEAQLEVGCCYEDAKGTEKDLRKAYGWYLKAAKAGNAGAQTNVGFCLMYGNGTGQDRTKAVEWFRMAAEQGNAVAQFNLGVLYENGDVVRRDLAESRKWYEKAAAQGIDKARERLSKLGR